MRLVNELEFSVTLLIMSIPGLVLAGLVFLFTGDLPIWLRMVIALVLWAPVTIAILLKLAKR